MDDISQAVYLLAMGMLLFAGCMSNTGPEVFIELSYAGSSGDKKLFYANVISGGDKFHWYGISSKEKKTITLHPGRGADDRITLFYKLTQDSPKVVWEGPVFQAEAGYRIEIAIHENGKVTEHSCKLPCELD
jgi:hypothetical protein